MKSSRISLFVLFIIFISVNYYVKAVIQKPFPTLLDISRNKIVSDLLKLETDAAALLERLHRILPRELDLIIEQDMIDLLAYPLSRQYGLFQEFKVHDTNVLSICISLDSEFILTGGCDSCAKVWKFNGRGYEFFQTLPGHFFKKGRARIDSLLISSDNKLVVTGSKDDDSVNIWKFDVSEYKHFQSLHCDSWILSVDISTDKQCIIIGSDNGFIYCWRFDGDKYVLHSCVKNDQAYPACVEFSIDKSVFMSLSSNYKTLYFWRDPSARSEGKYAVVGAIKDKAKFGLSGNKRNLATISYSSLNLFEFDADLTNYRQFKQFEFHGDCDFIKLPFDKPLLMTGGLNCPTKIFKFLKCTKQIYTNSLGYICPFYQDFVDIQKASGSEVRLVEVQVLQEGFGALVGDISEDGKMIVLGFGDGCMKIWKQLSVEQLLRAIKK